MSSTITQKIILILGLGSLLVGACSTTTVIGSKSILDSTMNEPFQAGTVTMADGFEFIGEMDLLPGETLTETVARAGGIRSVVSRKDVVRLVRPKEKLNEIVCLADNRQLQPGDRVFAVRMDIPSRRYPCEGEPSND